MGWWLLRVPGFFSDLLGLLFLLDCFVIEFTTHVKAAMAAD